MNLRRVRRALSVSCVLDAAIVTVDYRSGRARAVLGSVPTQQSAMPGPRWRPSWGSQELAYGWRPPSRPSVFPLLLAAPTLAITLMVLRFGLKKHAMARALWLLRLALRVRVQEASPTEAERLHGAVRWIGVFLPARVACLEESVATVLALALLRRHVTWCHGVSADPIEFHAWLRARDGSLIAEPASTQRFQALLTIPTRPRRQETNSYEHI